MPGFGGRVEWDFFNGYRVYVGDSDKILGVDSSDGYSTLWMF